MDVISGSLVSFDANPNGTCITDYTTNEVIPNFSHHKLTVFEYADGVNAVSISDEFQTYSTTRTDLDMYYEKVGLVYGQSSGRAIEPDYPSSGLDIQIRLMNIELLVLQVNLLVFLVYTLEIQQLQRLR